MSIPVGITVPKLLPITGTFAPLFAAYYTILNYRVCFGRENQNRFIGTPDSENDPLVIANRCQGNFVENVPLALFFGAVAEMNGGNRKVLTAGLSALFVFRVLHVELGLRTQGARGWGRFAGYTGTQAVIVGAAGYTAYLVKSYWGL